MNRHCFLLQVSPDHVDEYRRRHAAVWSDMLHALRDAGWGNYSLFMADDGLLVGYVECDDLDAALAATAQSAVNAEWQEWMAPLFLQLAGRQADQSMRVLDEVFHLQDQLAERATDEGDD